MLAASTCVSGRTTKEASWHVVCERAGPFSRAGFRGPRAAISVAHGSGMVGLMRLVAHMHVRIPGCISGCISRAPRSSRGRLCELRLRGAPRRKKRPGSYGKRPQMASRHGQNPPACTCRNAFARHRARRAPAGPAGQAARPQRGRKGGGNSPHWPANPTLRAARAQKKFPAGHQRWFYCFICHIGHPTRLSAYPAT